MRRAALDFLGGKRRRRLLELAGEAGGQPLEVFFIQLRVGVRAERRAVRVVGIGGKPEAEGALITLAAAGVKLSETRGPSEEQNQNAGSERVQRAQMADLPKAEDAADGFDHVMRGASARLIDDESPIVWRRTWFASHGKNTQRGDTPHSPFDASADSKGGLSLINT